MWNEEEESRKLSPQETFLASRSWWSSRCCTGFPRSSGSQLQGALGTFEPRGLGRHSAERLIMACKKMCSNSRTKWALLGSASVALVIAIGLVLSFVLQPHSPPGRGPCHAIWLASPSTALTPPLSHPTSPLRLSSSIFPSPSTRLVAFSPDLPPVLLNGSSF